MRQRLDRDFTTRRFLDAFSETERHTALPVQYQGQMRVFTIYSARELRLRRLFAYEFGQQGPAIYLGGVHSTILPLAKLVCQAYLCHWELCSKNNLLLAIFLIDFLLC